MRAGLREKVKCKTKEDFVGTKLKGKNESFGEKILTYLTTEELVELYEFITKIKISSDARTNRSWLLQRLKQIETKKVLLESEYIHSLLPKKLTQLVSFFESSLRDLDMIDLTKICKEINREDLLKEGMRKQEMMRKIRQNISILKIINSKSFKDALRPKIASQRDVRKIGSNIRIYLRKDIEENRRKIEELSSSIRNVFNNITVINRKIDNIDKKLEDVEKIFDIEPTLNLSKYLEVLNEEFGLIDSDISTEIFNEIDAKLRVRLNIDNRTYFLGGLQLLVLFYLMRHKNELKWKPKFDVFYDALKEEFDKVQVIENQAEIPALRERVCKRLSITDDIFDNFLLEAWNKDYVKLDIGSPIGRFNVKYLVTSQGQHFFYVKLLKR